MYSEIKNIKSEKKDLKNFGITIGLILFLISGILFYYDNKLFLNFFYVFIFFISLGLILPKFLKPIYLIWMTFAVILSWFMSRLILSLLFYFVISPIKLIAKVFGKNFLEISISSHVNSYWNHRVSEIEKNQDFTKQF
tara:strand:+ start:115 stop:528 length:414 start_codon:yes stop_codon:yes gene_type:complete